MQRRAQRDDQHHPRAKRAGGVNRVLAAAAALPVLLFAAACSSDSGSDSGTDAKQDTGSASDSSASAAPTVRAAAYKALPKACEVLSKQTLTAMVPKAKTGKAGSSDDPANRASCSWSSLANNGVKGSDFRWMNVSLVRFESDQTRGTGDRLAQEYYEKQVKENRAVSGATNSKSHEVSGTGDQATSVSYDLKKKEGSFKQETVIARVENVVVTLDYNGAGLAGGKVPDAAALLKLAEKATKEAVASVRSANGEGAPSTTSTPAPSKSASSKPSSSASASPSSSASKKS